MKSTQIIQQVVCISHHRQVLPTSRNKNNFLILRLITIVLIIWKMYHFNIYKKNIYLNLFLHRHSAKTFQEGSQPTSFTLKRFKYVSSTIAGTVTIWLYYFPWLDSSSGSRSPHFWGFEITLRPTTLGRNPLGAW